MPKRIYTKSSRYKRRLLSDTIEQSEIVEHTSCLGHHLASLDSGDCKPSLSLPATKRVNGNGNRTTATANRGGGGGNRGGGSNVSFEERYRKIGNGKEMHFADSVVMKQQDPAYTWYSIPPCNGLDQIKAQEPKRVLSLRNLCLRHISKYSTGINSEVLQTLPWRFWKDIWLCILKDNMDSFDLYLEFAEFFSHFPDFQSHLVPHIHACTSRDFAIAKSKIPRSRLHRLETIYENISINDFLRKLQRAKALVFLEIVETHWSREDYFKLFSVPNLCCLSLYVNIDDLFLHNLGSCINVGQLSKLTFLKIKSTKVTNKGIVRFIRAIERPPYNLKCLLVEHKFNEKGWTLLDIEYKSTISNFQIGRALHSLQEQGLIDPGFKLHQSKIVDVMVLTGTSFESANNFNLSWQRRNNIGQIGKKGYLYIRRNHKSIIETDSSSCKAKNKPILKKKLMIETDAKTFFGM
ncbi:hypothetical protein KGF56_004870 [Candida oxycetoniae]|uniref:Uncharacterized protein n=1 Tax=Candida oxycetoniae TaxID=497107 RepID=A0AAI9WVN1_9ASCO|nr:uncharacterized protein KGF56_004870 [Candida oxycetoniae]KAI3402300.2 hypothetical protein KGF56_004870 [Candida oxycetoniae]